MEALLGASQLQGGYFHGHLYTEFYIYDNEKLSLEGYISFDKSEKLSFVLEGGYVDYKYTQYNYEYLSNRFFTRIGADFNVLKPDISKSKYWAGVGLRYGISFYTSETPLFQHENYWGTVTSSIPSKNSTGHFIELTPGFRTEIFRNMSIGWTIRLKMLMSGGGSKDLKPIYLPGFGNAGKLTAVGVSYYIFESQIGQRNSGADVLFNYDF